MILAAVVRRGYIENGRGLNGSSRDRKKDLLETQRGAQVYGAGTASAWSAYNAERRAEDVQRAGRSTGRVAANGPVDGPPRMIQDVVEAGKKLEANFLHDLEGLRHRNVPLKIILVAEIQELSELAGRPVRNQEGRVGPAIGTDQLRVNGEPLQIGRVWSVQSRQRRIEHFLDLIQSHTGSEPDAVCGRVVGVVYSVESAGELDGGSGMEDKDRTQGPASNHAIEKAVVD